ncbi:DUF4125 family protein [Desulforhopalus vacuolatus]|uniref:DUF4125 family protein n=1 Tax=Desulforhopalus vacuolatus TaxID=40414 RepID=UPI001964D003|nr:DUF4125 family protein [Desulforhopalus vacuolatus]MBM9520975.1 DUF4125 family protein [Desulforhopalus vacuolatus]
MNTKELISEVVELETEMFLAVQSREPSSCQQDPQGFRFHRSVTFSIWTPAMLESYRTHLLEAKDKGVNLITSKYARMENLIPPQSKSPCIDKIVTMQTAWNRETEEKYPNLHRRARPVSVDSGNATSFATYLRGELETWDNTTLELYAELLQDYEAKGENPVEKTWENMAVAAGHNSLHDLEKALG